MKLRNKITVLSLLVSVFVLFTEQFDVYSQTATTKDICILQPGAKCLNTITTAVPFLLIAPDARTGALGDAGTAISPDANTIYWNPSKLAFISKDMGFSLTYTPWLRKLVPDISLSYLSSFKRISKVETIGLSLLYFSLGDIQFTGENGEPRGNFRPKEYAISGVYSRKLTDNLGIGFDMKFVLSDLASGQFVNGKEVTAGKTVAGGFSMFYEKGFTIGTNPNKFAWGLDIANIGNKITYTNSDDRDFIPTNMRTGFAWTTDLDEYNDFTFTVDLNKLLVPSPPHTIKSSGGTTDSIIKGEDDKSKSILEGLFGSFNDAPNGFEEEMREINYSIGLEYWYSKLFAVRTGYFYEDEFKGNRKYWTLGLGLKYNVFGLDFSYLIPKEQQHPLGETLRFTLSVDFEKSTPDEQRGEGQ